MDQFLVNALLLVYRGTSYDSHDRKRMRYCFEFFLERHWSYSWRLYSLDLITSQRPTSEHHHVGIEFNIWILEEHKYSVHNGHYQSNEDATTIWEKKFAKFVSDKGPSEYIQSI